MSQCTEIVQAFGKVLGVPSLNLNEHGVVQIKLESGLTYALEETEDTLLIQLLLPIVTFDAPKVKKRLLLLADYRKRNKYPVYILRYSSDNLILQIRLHSDELSVQSLEQSMEHLLHWAEYAMGQREML